MSITEAAWNRFCGVMQPARWAGCLTLSAGLLVFDSAAAQPSDRVTVQLKSGEKVSGRLEDLEGGTLYIRVSQDDQRKVPIGDVVLIDQVGGASGLPETELSRARESQPIVVLTNGSSVEGTLTDIAGGQGSGDDNKAREFIFRLPNGAERRLRAEEVGRVYMGNYPSSAGTPGATGTSGTTSSQAGLRVRVAAQERWTDTGLTVRSGQQVRFNTSGQVQLSVTATDVAQPAGGNRQASAGPLPGAPAGALIGRIGPNGRAFAVGNLTEVIMPESGRLYLGVNDDELSDNTGAFEVVLSPGSPR
jgi:small nuclear ribonucleoprotein (snRNP)-like protein